MNAKRAMYSVKSVRSSAVVSWASSSAIGSLVAVFAVAVVDEGFLRDEFDFDFALLFFDDVDCGGAEIFSMRALETASRKAMKFSGLAR